MLLLLNITSASQPVGLIVGIITGVTVFISVAVLIILILVCVICRLYITDKGVNNNYKPQLGKPINNYYNSNKYMIYFL